MKIKLSLYMRCEVCKSINTFKFLDLGKQPLCDDLISINSKKKCLKYPSQIFFCKNCYTALHKTKIKPSTLFPKRYHYRPRFTKGARRHERFCISRKFHK